MTPWYFGELEKITGKIPWLLAGMKAKVIRPYGDRFAPEFVVPIDFPEVSGLDEFNQQVVNCRDLRCLFLGRETYLCSIYVFRPFTCRVFGTEMSPCQHMVEI